MIKKILVSFFLVSNFCFSAEKAAQDFFKSQLSHANEAIIYKLFLSEEAVQKIDVIGEVFFKQQTNQAILKCCKKGYLKTFRELLKLKKEQESTWNVDFMKKCLKITAKDSLYYKNSFDGIEECGELFEILCKEAVENNIQMNQTQLDEILNATGDWILTKGEILKFAETQNAIFSIESLKECFISSLSDGIFHGKSTVQYMKIKNIYFNSDQVNDILEKLPENKFDPDFYGDFQNDLISVSFNPSIN